MSCIHAENIIAFLTDKALLRIFEEFDCIDKVYDDVRKINLEDFDFYIPLMSLPKIFNTEENMMYLVALSGSIFGLLGFCSSRIFITRIPFAIMWILY